MFHDTTDIDAVREEFLPQYYLNGETVPKTIAVDALPPDAEALNEALTQARGTKVELYVPQRGDVAKLVTMAYTNAVERLGRESGRYTREEKLLEVEHPVMGKKVVISPPWKMSETPATIRKASPLLGENNEEVFCGLLGMSKDEFQTLVSEEVIY